MFEINSLTHTPRLRTLSLISIIRARLGEVKVVVGLVVGEQEEEVVVVGREMGPVEVEAEVLEEQGRGGRSGQWMM